MKIKDDLLEGDNVQFVKTPNHSGAFNAGDLDTLIIHYTAGPTAKSAIRTLTSPRVKASAHIIIGKDGSITQLAPFNIKTWHAGPSSYKGRTGFNNYSIGIEIVNEGPLKKSGDVFRSWSGRQYTSNEVIEAIHRNQTTPKYWHVYTEEQIQVVFDLCQLLVETYNIKSILGHEEICPTRKSDPGPAFPLDRLRNKLLHENRDTNNDDELNETGRVMISKLNIRSSPIDGQVVARPLTKGTKVKLIEEKNGWYRVSTEIEGWVYSKYIETN